MHTHAYIIFIYRIEYRRGNRMLFGFWIQRRIGNAVFQSIHSHSFAANQSDVPFARFYFNYQMFYKRGIQLIRIGLTIPSLVARFFLCNAPHSFTWDMSMYNDRIDCGQTHLLLSMIGKWIVMSTYYKACGPNALEKIRFSILHWEKNKKKKKCSFHLQNLSQFMVNKIKRRWK